MQIGRKLIASLQEYADGAGPTVVRIAEEAVDHIKARTKSGVDRNNVAFAPYKPSYKRGKSGKRKGPGVNVDLVDTDKMVNSIGIISGEGVRFDSRLGGSGIRGATGGRIAKVKDTRISIGITDPRSARIATMHVQGGMKLPKRDFMGISSLWMQENTDKGFADLFNRTIGRAEGAEVVELRLM